MISYDKLKAGKDRGNGSRKCRLQRRDISESHHSSVAFHLTIYSSNDKLVNIPVVHERATSTLARD